MTRYIIKNARRHLAVTVALMAAMTAAAVAQESLTDRIDVFVRDEMQRQQVPGVAIGVVMGGSVAIAKGYGSANLEHQVAANPMTIFQSGSVGKQFTAVAVMLQVEDGKLSLSDPITKFFPDAPETWRNITVRHLLTHTSGIPDYEEDKLDFRRDYTEDDLARFAFALPLEFQPGSRWNYSNTGYVLLGIIVHRVSGFFYGDVLAERVFRPLGMTTARIISEADIIPNRAAGYSLEEGELKNQEWVAPSLNTTADGSIYFSLRDLIAWGAGIRVRAILRPESWELILQPVQLTSGKTYPYGFGWSLDERGGQPLQEHGGAWQGFTAHFSRFVGEDLSIIVLTNLAQASPVRFVNGIAEIVNPGLAVSLRPIEDREPEVTERLSRLLESARSGTLVPAEFAYVRAGFFPFGAKVIQEELSKLGPVTNLVLVDRVEKGDDRVYTYGIGFTNSVRYCMIGLAPDNRISLFRLRDW